MRFSVRSSFPATHRIRVDARGTLEPVHSHNWRVEACFEIESGADTAAAAARDFLAEWAGRYSGKCFNDVTPFDRVNPTAEEVARVFAGEISAAVPDARIVHIEVGEAAGFSAIYFPDR